MKTLSAGLATFLEGKSAIGLDRGRTRQDEIHGIHAGLVGIQRHRQVIRQFYLRAVEDHASEVNRRDYAVVVIVEVR